MKRGNPLGVSVLKLGCRLACQILSAVCICGSLIAGAGMVKAESYRPMLVLEKIDLSGELEAPFSISKMDDEVTDAASGTIVDDAAKGKALHITNRSNSSAGLSVDLSAVVREAGGLRFSYRDGQFEDGEFFGLSFSIKAEKGKSFYIMPVLGGGGELVWNEDQTNKLKDSNGYLGNPEARWKVTDEWATIGLSKDGTLSFFAGDETYQVYQPNRSSWCSLYFVTFSDPDQGIWKTPVIENYYISEVQFWGPKTLENTADGFVEAAAMLPDPAYANQSMRATIQAMDTLYEGLSAADRKVSEVAAGKQRLDALRNAMKNVRSPFEPVYTYRDESNLLAPYGDLESFDGSTLIWSEAAGAAPTFTLIEGGGVAKQGSKCLEISDRESRGDVSVDLTQILRDNGEGEYQFSCWIKSKTPGTSLEVLPLLLYVFDDGTTAEYEIGECIVGDTWTLVGAMEDEERYFRYSGHGPEKVTDDVRYVALRLYVTNLDADPEYGDELYGDYYIDDLRFWKTTAPATTIAPTESTQAAATTASVPPAFTQPPTAPTTEPSGSGGLSMGAGVAIGVLCSAVVLGGLFCLYWFLLRKQPEGPQSPDAGTPEGSQAAETPDTSKHGDLTEEAAESEASESPDQGSTGEPKK